MATEHVSYLSLFLEQVADCFTEDVAKRVLSIRVDDPKMRTRIEELADKANEGLLSEDERTEYADYIEASDLLAILQARARRLLARHGT